MKLIIGLGNPGKTYAKTRHNVGWVALGDAARLLEAGAFQEKKAFHAEIAEAHLGAEKILLVRPLTFMNLSGNAVRALMDFFHVERAKLLVIHDEMDYPVGKMGFTAKAGPAGHNGVLSIQETLGTKEINRLRVGIGRPTGEMKAEDYVLQTFSKEERSSLKPVVENAGQAVVDWVRFGIDKASGTWNGK